MVLLKHLIPPLNLLANEPGSAATQRMRIANYYCSTFDLLLGHYGRTSCWIVGQASYIYSCSENGRESTAISISALNSV